MWSLREYLYPQVIFLTIVAAQNKYMRTEILQSISGTYPNLVSIPIPEDVVMGLPSVANSLTDSGHNVPPSVSATLDRSKECTSKISCRDV